MKLILASIAAVMALTSCADLDAPYHSVAPGGRNAGFVPTPPPKFSGAGTQQSPMTGHVDWYNNYSVPYLY